MSHAGLESFWKFGAGFSEVRWIEFGRNQTKKKKRNAKMVFSHKTISMPTWGRWAFARKSEDVKDTSSIMRNAKMVFSHKKISTPTWGRWAFARKSEDVKDTSSIMRPRFHRRIHSNLEEIKKIQKSVSLAEIKLRKMKKHKNSHTKT